MDTSETIIQPEELKIKCYQCGNLIIFREGKYFCNQDCWDEYSKTYKTRKKLTLKEIQAGLLELGKQASIKNKFQKNQIEIAEEIFSEP